MKTVFILISIFLISCSSKKGRFEKEMVQKQEVSLDNLSAEEKKIVNDFLDFELKRDRYNRYKDFDYVIIDEALKKYQSIFDYEIKYTFFRNRKIKKGYWLWDSIQIKKVKADLKSEKQYYWKTTDFTTLKIGILKNESFLQSIQKDGFLFLPKRLIIRLSRPLMFDKNSCLISFEIGNSQLGFSTISEFTVMMKKKEGKWVKEVYFADVKTG